MSDRQVLCEECGNPTFSATLVSRHMLRLDCTECESWEEIVSEAVQELEIR